MADFKSFLKSAVSSAVNSYIDFLNKYSILLQFPRYYVDIMQF